MRVVIDTNVFVSGLFFDGKPRTLLNLISERKITPCFIPSTFLELKIVLLHKKFQPQRELLSFSIEEFLRKIKEYSLFFPEPSKVPHIIKEDKADNYFLACTLLAGAPFIISGDKHLLKLKEFQRVSIFTPQEFLKKFRKRK